MVSTKILGNHLRLLAPPRLFCLKYKGLCGEPELKDSPKIPVQSHQTSHKRAICGYTRKKDDIPGYWQITWVERRAGTISRSFYMEQNPGS